MSIAVHYCVVKVSMELLLNNIDDNKENKKQIIIIIEEDTSNKMIIKLIDIFNADLLDSFDNMIWISLKYNKQTLESITQVTYYITSSTLLLSWVILPFRSFFISTSSGAVGPVLFFPRPSPSFQPIFCNSNLPTVVHDGTAMDVDAHGPALVVGAFCDKNNTSS